MDIKKNPIMLAMEARAKQFEQYLGEKLEITNLAGDLRHVFTGEIFPAAVAKIVEFDQFLLGQLLHGRVTAATVDGTPLGAAPVEIVQQVEGSGVTSPEVKSNVEQLIKESSPVPEVPETPVVTEPAAPVPETPAEEPAPEAPAEPAATTKPSILKKAAS